MKTLTTCAVTLTMLAAVPNFALAEVKVGVIVSATGPASSLGIPERDAIALAPKTLHGEEITYIILDDASDPTAARRHIERLTTDEKVDIILGSSTSPSSIAMTEVAGRTRTPMVSFGASRAIVWPMDAAKAWSFKTPYNDSTTAAATVRHMVANGVKRVATFGVNDAYGEGWINEFKPLAATAGLEIVASELYGARDTAVTAQTLKVISARPDAVLITASGTPGALPATALNERNYKGKMYQTTGVVSADFLRVGGKAVEGTLIAANPLSVAGQLPEGHVAREAGVSFSTQFDAAYGAGKTSSFAGYAWDAVMLMDQAMPAALAAARPGTPEFRAALRDSLEGLKGATTTAGPVTMSAEDHNGYAGDAPVMITVKDAKFVIAQ